MEYKHRYFVMKEQKRDGHGQTHAHAPNKNNEQLTTEDQSNEVTENPQEEVREIQQKEESAEDKIAELNDRYLRLAAEFDNYRRRTAKERLDLVVTAGEETIKGLLTILDDLERALELLSKTEGDHSIAIEGTELIYNKLLTYLESKGLKKIDAKDKELNTDFHEAIAQLPASSKSHKNKIIEVVQQGYTLNGKVIRFAKVVVGI
jgi:molecular chaperone GrpE